MIDVSLLQDSLPRLIEGAKVSLQIAALGCGIGLTFGSLLGILHSGSQAILRILVSLYVTLFRGTPMLVQIAFMYFVLPEIGIAIPAFWTAVIAIGLNSSAYISQIVRSGISSVGKGQIEAGRVLGLNNRDIMRYIVLPQALRVVIPALGNEFVTLIKDSSLASTIGVAELTKEGSIIRSQTFDVVTTYFGVALMYLIMTTTLSMAVNFLERRMSRHVKH
ncbi:amino acid ABC transporter permease [Candidatus Dependentiae bacterium]|nr:amino acid ABC transporter permease [Candidatus Dependentiae bacterium]